MPKEAIRKSSEASEIGQTHTANSLTPAGWKLLSLEAVADPNAPIRYGVVQIGPHTPDGVPIVPIKFIDRIGSSTLHRTTNAIEQSYAGSRIQGGDVLISVKGTIGRVGVVPVGFHGNIAREIARIRPKSDFCSDFIALQLEADHTQNLIAKATVGSTRLEFSIAAVRALIIPIPEKLSEQRKIADILRTWDKAIYQLGKLMNAKRALVKASYRRFFDPCHESFENRTRHWTKFTLGEVFKERDEPGRDEDKLLSITMSGGVIDREDVGRKDTSNDDKSTYKLILPGDIGYNTMRMWQGVSGLSQLRGIVSPAYTIVTPDERNIFSRYAAHLFKSRRMVFDFERYSQGLTSDTWNLKFPAFSKISVYLPAIETQRLQADLLDLLHCEITTLKNLHDVIIKQKRGLMQRLLTGELRVPSGTGGSDG